MAGLADLVALLHAHVRKRPGEHLQVARSDCAHARPVGVAVAVAHRAADQQTMLPRRCLKTLASRREWAA